MKRGFFITVISLIIFISFIFYYKYQQNKVVENKMLNIPVDKFKEQDEIEKQIVKDFFNDSTIQIVDYENGIFQKDSVKFFYNIKWKTYLVIPDSFNLEVAEDNSLVNAVSENAEIKTWVYPRDEEIWKENNQLKERLIKEGIKIETLESTDSVFVISGEIKKGDVLSYSYLKILPFSDEIDLFISYQTPSEYKEEKIIRNVIKQYPNKPF